MKRILVILLLLTLIVEGASWWRFHPVRPPQRANLSEFETDMTAGLLRGIFQEQGADRPPVFFVAFGEARTAPSYAFMARFAGQMPPVRALTSAVMTPTGMVFETSTGRPGVIIQVIRFKEYIPGTFDVLVALSTRPGGHDRFTYRVTGRGDDWTIKSRQPA
jgi:hypothetical protein